MTNNTLLDEVGIPEESINTVLEWIRAEQVRIINNDRIFYTFRGNQVDQLTELRTTLVEIMDNTKADNREICRKNEIIQNRIDREAFNKAQEETIALLSEKSTHKKVCASYYVECTCRNK